MARRRDRELPAMTLSFLDVMSCGFGAAVLLMVLLAMNTGGPSAASIAELRSKLRDAQERQGTFLLTTIIWDEKPVDIDLYVTAPNGQTCSFQAPEVPLANGTTMTLFFDVRTEASGRPEGILVPRASPGIWQIGVQYYAGMEPVFVRGTLRGSHDEIDLPVERLGPDRYRELIPLAAVAINERGDMELVSRRQFPSAGGTGGRGR